MGCVPNVPQNAYDQENTVVPICKKIVFLFFLWIPFSAVAFTIPAEPQGYVHDAAGILPSDVGSLLDTELRDFDKKTSTQVVVAVFKSLEGESLEDLSLRLVEHWKIGRKGRDNGVLFLVFLDDRKMRIEVGYGLEGVLTDHLSQQIIRGVVTPQFKAGKIAEGLVAGARAIMAVTQGEFTASDRPISGGGPKSLLVLILFVAVIMGFSVLQRKMGTMVHYRQTGGHGGFSSGGWRSSGGGFSGGGGSFGGGGSSGSW